MLMEDIFDKIIGPLKLPDKDPRSMEDTDLALFELCEQVSDKSPLIRENVLYSLFFMIIWLFLTFIIFLQTVIRLNLPGAIILFFLLLSGLFTCRLLFFNYQFYEYYSRRFHAIQLVQEGNPNIYVPGGDTPVDRFLNHLRGNYQVFHSFLDAHPESIQFSAIIRGRTGAAYQFDAYIGIPGGSSILKNTNLPTAIIKRGYALFIKVLDEPPTLRDITALEHTVQDITALTCLPPRVIVLAEGAHEELPDDLYRHVTDEGALAKCRKGSYQYNVQVVNLVQGEYYFIPMISSKGLP